MTSFFFEENGPRKLQRRDGRLVATSEALAPYRYVLVYLAAHWYPPCRNFTPQLKHFYEEHGDSKNFTVVFLSLDSSPEEMQGHFSKSHGDWLAVPFEGNQPFTKAWTSKYRISDVPVLLVFENLAATSAQRPRLTAAADGTATSDNTTESDAANVDGRRLVTSAGCRMLASDASGADFPWPAGDAAEAEASRQLMYRYAVVVLVLAIAVAYTFLV